MKLRHLLLYFFLIFKLNTSFAIEFLDISLDDAVQQAKVERKYFFLYFTAQWCGPCKLMEKTVFNQDTVNQYFNENYIALKIDGDSWKGEKLKKKFPIDGYPTFFLLDSSGKVINSIIGFLKINEFLKFVSINNSNSGNDFNFAKGAKKVNKKSEYSFGIRFGVISSTLLNEDSGNRIGFQTDIFLSIEKNRFLLRPSIGYISKGNENLKLDYLTIPIDLGFTFYKGAIFGLPGGFRAIVTPYYSFLVNHSGNNKVSNYDFGLAYGISTYIGDTNKIELFVFVNNGLNDLKINTMGSQNNQAFGLSASLSIF